MNIRCCKKLSNYNDTKCIVFLKRLFLKLSPYIRKIFIWQYCHIFDNFPNDLEKFKIFLMDFLLCKKADPLPIVSARGWLSMLTSSSILHITQHLLTLMTMPKALALGWLSMLTSKASSTLLSIFLPWWPYQ